MKYTNKHGLPKSLVEVITGHTYDKSKSDPYRLGITTLISPPCLSILSQRHWEELEEDVSDHIWRITGNAYHYILSKSKVEEGKLIEEKMEIPKGLFTIVGKLDIYSEETIEDWKISSVWSFKLGDKEEWDNQINSYAWMLRTLGYPVQKGFINGILRDWSKSDSKRYEDYPKIPFKRIEIKIWPFEKQEEYINERIALFEKAMHLPDDQLPTCSEKERWRSEDKYAVYKGSNQSATKLFDTQIDAEAFVGSQEKPKIYRIEKREGKDSRCADYCLVNKFCPYYKKNYEKKTQAN